MSSYSGNCLCFRSTEPTSQLTNSHISENDMVFELIGILGTHPCELLVVSDYLSTHPDTDISMTQEQYISLVREHVSSFQQLLEWCKSTDISGDFNNFDSGWSVSMSVYS